jgi:protein-disulfide isomerase
MTRTLLVAAWLMIAPSGLRQTPGPDPLANRAKGRADAPITIYEMSDFQCPFCRSFTLETMPALEREYVTTGKARVVYINLPLPSVHKNATVAAQAALCAAEQGRFWPMHDLLFRHQDEWAPRADPRDAFLTLADSAGLVRARFTRCLRAGATAAAVQSDAERARRAGARSTPTFYIEGGLLEGAAPMTVFRAVLDSIYRSKTGAQPR